MTVTKQTTDTREHSYVVSFRSTLPDESIYADESDLTNLSPESKKNRTAVSYSYSCWIQYTDKLYQYRTCSPEKKVKRTIKTDDAGKISIHEQVIKKTE